MDLKNQQAGLAAEIESELGRILSFWKDRMVDHENEGFIGRIDSNQNVLATSPKGAVLNTRILWAFSAAHQVHPDKGYIQYATSSFEYILQHFVDETCGGIYWMVNYRGEALDTKKQVYAQAFAIYALAEYFKISQDPRALRQAIDLFNLIEKHSFDSHQNGYLEAFDRQWNLLDDLRLSDKDANEIKTMNTHLHVMEAYSNLLKVYPDPKVKMQLQNLIDLFLYRFLNQETGQYQLFFDEDWNLKSNEISYGHDIETAWLLHEAAICLGDELRIRKCEELAVKTAKATLPFFDKDGALFNAGEPGHITDREKHWWPQAEALVGLMNAYQVSGQDMFVIQLEECWGYIKSQLLDVENGEWIWGRTTSGHPMKEDKAGPWKCPYHNGRAMIEMLSRLS